MHPDKTVKKKKRVWYGSATLEYGPECLIIPLPTRKIVVEMKRGRNLVVSFSFSRKLFPSRSSVSYTHLTLPTTPYV